MADSTPTATPSNDTKSCFFRRTVTLYDWWLVKAKDDFQGKRLAIAGVSSRKDEAMRVFVSSPIIKRYDEFSLETVDGIYVIISGFINEQRTIENGFNPQVFNRFLFGFPPDWESHALDFSRKESITGNDLGSAFLDDVPASCPEILSNGAEECTRTSLISPEEAPGDHGKLFPGSDCNVSKGIDGVNLFCSDGGKRRSARLHDIKACLQRKQAASGGISMASESCDVEGSRSPTTPIQSQTRSEYSVDDCVENSIPTFLASPEKVQGDQEKAFPENECNVSEDVDGVNVACSRGRERRSAKLHDVEVFQRKKQSASGLPPKNPNNKNHTSVAALDNCNVVEPKSPETPIQSQSWRQLCTSSEQIVTKSASIISRTLSPKTEGCHKKKVGRSKGTLNKSASAGKNSRLRDRSQLTKGKIRTSSEQIVTKSASIISRTLSPKTEGCHKKKVGRSKGTLNKSASAGKNSRLRDRSQLTKGSGQKKSTVSPELSSFRTSRSGRLLLPPLEFWRNQIPIYDADHELKEIKDGASLISPCRVSSPSSSRLLSLGICCTQPVLLSNLVGLRTVKQRFCKDCNNNESWCYWL
ncbi:kinetochore-associated protein KNL-2 homolog isoform X2 [Vigna unguiculata]|uniref:kinetochore-associated protein KNL-2 homolog isoform X2 n=1 Tax=Vigna unguiculata TaxID=3917 RepID=UPI001015D70E|nr:kinetochore-associated protein KNL-2 homolog isoform X2 [Vigna unguiculata]